MNAVDPNNVDRDLTGVAFKDNTDFIELNEGTYDVSFAVEGGKTAAIGPARITIENGNVYTAIARGPDPLVTNDTFGLILMGDFVTP